jgi:hypothetical protein
MVADDFTHWLFVGALALVLLVCLIGWVLIWHENRAVKRGKTWPVDPRDSWERRRR